VGVKTVAVVIAAYRAERWVHEAVASVMAQQVPQGWAVRLDVGVDGCEATSAALTAAGVPHYFSARNVGAYIIRNSLIQQSPADAYAIFDADDRMRLNYLAELLPSADAGEIVGAARVSIAEDGTPKTGKVLPFAHGVAVIPHSAWERVGGYRPWRIAADSDLIARARALGIGIRSHPAPLYERRVHPDSLTSHRDTGMKSHARLKLKRQTARDLRYGKLHVTPKTVPLEGRGGS